MKLFSSVMGALSLVVFSYASGAEDAKTALAMCREHKIGLKLEVAGRVVKTEGDIAEQVHVAELLLESRPILAEVQLALRAEMKAAFDKENLELTGGLAKRFLELLHKKDGSHVSPSSMC